MPKSLYNIDAFAYFVMHVIMIDFFGVMVTKY